MSRHRPFASFIVNFVVLIAFLTSPSARSGEPVAAVGDGQPAPAAASVEAGRDWPLFRGDPRSTGVAQTTLPDQPSLLWKYQVPKGSFEGTPAIVDGVVYIGDLDGSVLDRKSVV